MLIGDAKIRKIHVADFYICCRCFKVRYKALHSPINEPAFVFYFVILQGNN